MNALVTMEAILEPAAGVVLSADSIFGTGSAETIVSAIEKQVRAEVFDITTEDGRKRVKSIAYKIARSKTTLDEIGKDHVAGFKAKSAAVDKERKTIRDRLDALNEEVRGPLTAWEEAEKARVEKREAFLVSIIESVKFDAIAPGVDVIRDRIQFVAAYSSIDWEEFRERADVAAKEALAMLEIMLATAEQHERDQAELIELRRLRAEREEADRLAAAAAQAAEQARQEAEQKAARAAAEAERIAEWQRKREEQAERDVQAAVAATLERDRQRAAAQKAAEEAAERKRQENKRHRAKVHAEIIAALEPLPASAAAILEAIDRGAIPHVSINY
jgi:hypothetical protein